MSRPNPNYTERVQRTEYFIGWHPHGFCQGMFMCGQPVEWLVNDKGYCTEHAMKAIAESEPGAKLVLL